MAGRDYKAGILITGDASGAQKAIKLTEAQLEALNRKAEASRGVSSKLADSWAKSGISAGDFSKQLASLSGSVAKWGAAAAAAAAVGAAAFVKHAIDVADSSGKAAAKLGITTEAYSRLSYAANIADVSQSALDGSMRKAAKTLTEAAGGSKSAAAAFTALGLSARELINLPADEQLGIIADRLNAIENPTQRAALAMKVFGRSGTEMLNLTREGSAGIKRLTDEAERYGVVISGEMAGRADAFNDSLDRLGAAAQGVGLSVADKLLEPMGEFSERLAELAAQKETAEGIAAFIEGIGTAVVATAEAVATTGNVFTFLGEEIAAMFGGPAIGDVERISERIQELKNQLAYVPENGLFSDTHNQEVRAAIQGEIAALENMLRVSAELAESSQRAAAAVAAAKDKQAAASGRATAAARVEVGAYRDTAAAMDREADMAQVLAEANEKQGDKTAELIKKLREKNTMLGMGERAQAIYTARLEAGTNATAEQIAQVEALAAANYDLEAAQKVASEAAQEQEAALKKAAAQADPWAEAMQDAAARVDSAFVDLWKSIGKGFDDFADTLKEAFTQLLAELAHEAITKPIVVKIASAFGFGGGGGSGGGGGTGGLSLGSLGSLWGWGKGVVAGWGSGGAAGAWGAATEPLAGLFGGGSVVGYTPAGAPVTSAGGTSFSGGGVSLAGAAWAALAVGIVRTLDDLADGTYKIRDILTGHSLGMKYEDQLNGMWGGLGDAFSQFGRFGNPLVADPVLGPLVLATGSTQGKWGKLGVQVGGLPDEDADKTVTAASGLSLSAVEKRINDNGADALLEAFLGVDKALTEAARGAGATVDFKGVSFGNTSLAVDHNGAVNAFGVAGRLDNLGNVDATQWVDQFARAWVDQIDEQLSDRMRAMLGDVGQKTAEQILQVFSVSAEIDRLLKIKPFEKVAEQAAAASKSVLDVYGELTEKVLEVAGDYDGTLESMTALTAALADQKAVALDLAAAYEAVSNQVDALFGDAITAIEESLLAPSDLYAKRRSEIAELTDSLAETIDPQEIATISAQIEALARSAWSLLDDGQKKELGAEFIDFLGDARDLAAAQIEAGRDSLTSREEGLGGAVDLELINTAAQTQQAAADTFAAAVADFSAIFSGWSGVGGGNRLTGHEVNQ